MKPLTAWKRRLMGVDRAWRIGVQDRLLKELEQHLVQAAQLHDRAVVALHELLDRQVRVVVAVSELLGKRALIVEQQAILAPSRESGAARNAPARENS